MSLFGILMFVFNADYEGECMNVCVCVCGRNDSSGGGVVGWGDTHVLIIGPGYAKLFARWWVAVCLPRRLLP